MIDLYRPEDRAAVDALFRRVFGTAPPDRARWEWQYLENPCNAGRPPQIWLAREHDSIVGQCASIPVRLSVDGQEVDGAWAVEFMVAPECQRRGIGEQLFQHLDHHAGASFGMGLSVGSYRLFLKLGWPDVGPVPHLVKPLTPRAFHRSHWPRTANRLVTLLATPVLAPLRIRRPAHPRMQRVEHFDDRFTALWERIAPKFDFAARRDAAYLEWRYVSVPRPRYTIAAFARERAIAGYAVYRHAEDARGRSTRLVDLLADPEDGDTIAALLGWVEHEARAAGSHKIRAIMMHAGFRQALRRHKYFRAASAVELVAKINAVPVGPAFYADTSRWHVTFGDSDQDR